MSKGGGAVLAFAGLWVLFATVSWDWGNKVTIYGIDAKGGYPRYKVEYAVVANRVSHKLADYIYAYDDCRVFDKNNWVCTYGDKSGKFQLFDGNFARYTNAAWPSGINYRLEQDIIYVSRFRYVVASCDFGRDVAGWVWGAIGCLLRPFIA